MKNFALRVAGVIFLLIAGVHFYRYLISLPIRVGDYLVPMDSSLFAGFIILLLSIWMFFVARK